MWGVFFYSAKIGKDLIRVTEAVTVVAIFFR
jgi:hypothetical protein